MATKRPPDDDPISFTKYSSTAPSRHNDFSGSVKKKLADSKRTGQACDRCKIRKIRCDGRPEGCTPYEFLATARLCSSGCRGKERNAASLQACSLGDNYLGVAAGDSPLSHIKGTSLSIFGTEIDITDFMAGETEYEASPMSYTTLINIAISVSMSTGLSYHHTPN
ncbi:transcription factor cys6 protein, partial [Pyrenophora tritici-repentis]